MNRELWENEDHAMAISTGRSPTSGSGQAPGGR